MKSKATTYVLIAAVMVIWGVILWKFFRKQDEPYHVAAPPRIETAAESADTLVLNYRDPFLGVRPVSKKTPARQSTTGQNRTPAPKPEPVVHRLRFLGRITRNKTEFGLVEINGVLHTMSAGEQTDGYRLEKIYEDSVRLKWKGETCTAVLGR